MVVTETPVSAAIVASVTRLESAMPPRARSSLGYARRSAKYRRERFSNAAVLERERVREPLGVGGRDACERAGELPDHRLGEHHVPHVPVDPARSSPRVRLEVGE